MYNGLILQGRKDLFRVIIFFGAVDNDILLVNGRVTHTKVSGHELHGFILTVFQAAHTVPDVATALALQPTLFTANNAHFNILRPYNGLIVIALHKASTIGRNGHTLITALVQERNGRKDQGRHGCHRRSTKGVRQRNRVRRQAAIPVGYSQASLTVTMVSGHGKVLNVVHVDALRLRVGKANVTFSNTPRIKVLRNSLTFKVVNNTLDHNLRHKRNKPIKRSNSTHMFKSHSPSNSVTNKASNSTRIHKFITQLHQGNSTVIGRLRRVQVNSRVLQSHGQNKHHSLYQKLPGHHIRSTGRSTDGNGRTRGEHSGTTRGLNISHKAHLKLQLFLFFLRWDRDVRCSALPLYGDLGGL